MGEYGYDLKLNDMNDFFCVDTQKETKQIDISTPNIACQVVRGQKNSLINEKYRNNIDTYVLRNTSMNDVFIHEF